MTDCFSVTGLAARTVEARIRGVETRCSVFESLRPTMVSELVLAAGRKVFVGGRSLAVVEQQVGRLRTLRIRDLAAQHSVQDLIGSLEMGHAGTRAGLVEVCGRQRCDS